MREAKRTLRDDGVMWMVIGDTYSTPKKGNTQDNVNSKLRRNKLHEQGVDKKIPKGMKKKNLLGIPWKVAFALQEDGWILRCDAIWNKTNGMPDGAKDRPTRNHEYIFMFTKEENYYYDYKIIMEIATSQKQHTRKFGAKNQEGTFRQDQDRYFTDNGMRNKRSVWSVPVASSGGKHFGVFPISLIEPCVLSSASIYGCCHDCGSPFGKDDNGNLIENCECQCNEPPLNCRVLDPFSGTATTGVVCLGNGIDYVGIELNEEYIEISKERLDAIDPIFG
jgi:DNA modification methylase